MWLKILGPILVTLSADALPGSSLSLVPPSGGRGVLHPGQEAWRVEEFSSLWACCFRAGGMPGDPAVLFLA